jgi:hypothetical protein
MKDPSSLSRLKKNHFPSGLSRIPARRLSNRPSFGYMEGDWSIRQIRWASFYGSARVKAPIAFCFYPATAG